MKTSDRIQKIILICFYIGFSFLMLFIAGVNFLFPLHYLVPWKMMIASVLFGALFFGALKLWNLIPEKIVNSKILFAATAFIGIALIWVITLVHGKGHLGVGDYFMVYHSAEELAEGKDITYYNYFMVYGNNTVPMLLLSTLIRFSRMIGIDEFYFLLVITSAFFILSIWGIGELTLECSEKIRIPMVLMFMICLPVYVFTGTFYTDAMSFGVGIIAVALIKAAIRKKFYFLIPFAALFSVWGILFKITAIIPLIGAVCALFFFPVFNEKKKEEKKKILIVVSAYLILTVAVFIGIKGIASTSTVYRESNERSNPLSAWIAMGMKGNGSYAENVEFSDEINALTTKEEKSVLAKQYMKEHLGEAFSINHLVRKAQNNFASGMFTCFDYTTPDDNGSILYKVLDPGGALFGRSCQFTFCYISIIYLFTLFGSIRAVILLIGKKGEKASDIISFPKVLADISIFGIIIFLMLWESNNRQLYNQLPVLILSIFANVWDIIDREKSFMG